MTVSVKIKYRPSDISDSDDIPDIQNSSYVSSGADNAVNNGSCTDIYKENRTRPTNHTLPHAEAGLTLYMDELHHYDLCVTKSTSGYAVLLKLNIGGIRHVQAAIPVTNNTTHLVIETDSIEYRFYLMDGCENPQKVKLGSAYTKYLSIEVAGGFTGVVIGLYAIGDCTAVFRKFRCSYPGQPEL